LLKTKAMLEKIDIYQLKTKGLKQKKNALQLEHVRDFFNYTYAYIYI